MVNTEAPYFTVCRGEKIMFDLFKCQMKGIICVHMQNKVHFYIFSSKQCLSCAKVVAVTLGVVHVLFYIFYFIALHCIALQKKVYIIFIVLHCIALFCKIKKCKFFPTFSRNIWQFHWFYGFRQSEREKDNVIER